MYAVLKTGGKQYRVKEDDILEVEKIEAHPGDKLIFKDVCMVADGKDVVVNIEALEKSSVEATVIEQTREKKIKVFKKKRRKDYQRTLGHKQQLTRIQIVTINR